MPRPRKNPEDVLVNPGLRVRPEIDQELEHIAKTEQRPKANVTRQIFMRGWAAYKRDGQLVEPEYPAKLTHHLRIVGRVSAGQPIEAVFNEELIEVAPSDIEGVRNPRALRVVGDSMIDAMVLDGDIIIVGDAGEPAGKIVVAEIEGEGVTLKRWRQNGNRVTLEPANPDYKVRTISINRVKALAVLIKSIRFYVRNEEEEAAADAA